MRLPSRIGTMSLRSTIAIDCSSFSIEFRRAISSGSAARRLSGSALQWQRRIPLQQVSESRESSFAWVLLLRERRQMRVGFGVYE